MYYEAHYQILGKDSITAYFKANSIFDVDDYIKDKVAYPLAELMVKSMDAGAEERIDHWIDIRH